MKKLMTLGVLSILVFLVTQLVAVAQKKGQEKPQKPESFKVRVYVDKEGKGIDERAPEQELLTTENLSTAGVLVFVRSTDEEILKAAKNIWLFVESYTKKGEKPNAHVVYLVKTEEAGNTEPKKPVTDEAKKPVTAAKTPLTESQKALIAANLGFEVYINSGDVPAVFDIKEDAEMTVVMWAKSGIIKPNDVLSAEDIEGKEENILLRFIDVLSK